MGGAIDPIIFENTGGNSSIMRNRLQKQIDQMAPGEKYVMDGEVFTRADLEDILEGLDDMAGGRVTPHDEIDWDNIGQ